jgi:hypothetical protein
MFQFAKMARHVSIRQDGEAMLLVLITIVLALHLVMMNLASAGPLVSVALQFRKDSHSHHVGRKLVQASLHSLWSGIVLGFVLLGLTWLSKDRGYWDALQRFPTDDYVFAVLELIFTIVCLVAYLWTWNRWSRRPWLHGWLGVLAATNLLYHFPPLMAAISQLAVRPELVAEQTITRSLVLDVMARPEVLAMTVHFALASLAVAGLAVMAFARSTDPSGAPVDEIAAAKLLRFGSGVALAPTMLQLVVGMWLLTALPTGSRTASMGGDWLATTLLAASFVAALALMQTLAAVMMGETRPAQTKRANYLLLLVVVLMVGGMLRGRNHDSGIRMQGAATHSPTPASWSATSAASSSFGGSFLSSSSSPPGHLPALMRSP